MQQMIDEAGNIWNVDAQGNPVSFAGSANQRGAGVQIKPADPKQPFVAPQAGADLEGTQLTNEQKRAALMEAKYGKLPAGMRWKSDMSGAEWIPGVTPPKSAAQIAREGEAKRGGVIRQFMQEVRGLYERDLKGGWPNSIVGNIPFRPANEEFNTAANGILPLIRPLVAQTAKEGDSDKEMQVFMSYIPQASDSDRAIERKLNMLETLIGGMIGGETPSQLESQVVSGKRQMVPLASLSADIGGGQGGPTAPVDPFGQGGPTVLPNAADIQETAPMEANDVTSKGGLVPISELAGYENQVIDLIGRGASTEQVVGYMNERLGKFGASVGPELQSWIGGIVRKHRANPSQPVRSLGQGWEMLYHKKAPEEQQSFLGIDPDSTVGNFVAQGSNAMLAGAPAYFAGKQDVLGAAARERPGSTLAGEVVGGTAGMLGVNRIAGTLGKTGSLLTRSGGVGGDAAFGATRGAFDGGPEGAIAGGLVAGLGNKIGGGAVRTIGRGVRGVSDPAVRYLAERGVPMTAGQLLGNRGFTGKMMNKLESLPGIGESLAARRVESMTALNRAAMEDAGRGIGFNPPATGFEGVESGLASAGNAMDNAVAGVDVPMDQTAIQQMRAAIAAGQSLPDDLAAKFGKAIENRVAPALDTGRLTGKDYQQTIRGIRGYQAETPNPGFEADYRDALGGVEDALTGAVTRGAGREVSENLGKANTAYRDFKLLEDAVKKAQSGSASGAQEIFTPAQLQAAVRASKYAKSGTKEPFAKLTRAGQEVLPSTVPNTGSADRAMAMALPGLLGAGAAGVGNYVDPKAALPLAVLAALSSRTGAKVAQKALTGRSTAARTMGRKIIQQRRKAGLFGAATGVAMLPQSSQ